MKIGAKRGRSRAISAKVPATKSRRNFSQRTHPIHPIGPKTHVLVRFGPFVMARKLEQNGAELVQLVQMFVQRSGVGTFCNECTRSTPLDPELMFWWDSDHIVTARKLVQNGAELVQLAQKFVQNSCFGAFWTVSLLHESWCKTGPNLCN